MYTFVCFLSDFLTQYSLQSILCKREEYKGHIVKSHIIIYYYTVSSSSDMLILYKWYYYCATWL